MDRACPPAAPVPVPIVILPRIMISCPLPLGGGRSSTGAPGRLPSASGSSPPAAAAGGLTWPESARQQDAEKQRGQGGDASQGTEHRQAYGAAGPRVQRCGDPGDTHDDELDDQRDPVAGIVAYLVLHSDDVPHP